MTSIHNILKSKKYYPSKKIKPNKSKLSKIIKDESIFRLNSVKQNRNYFSGSGKDMIFGIMYLIKKFNNVCDVTKRSHKIRTTDFMYDITIMYVCNNNVNAKPKDYELLFPYGKENFDSNLKQCKKRFVIVPLFFESPRKCVNDIAHYNVLVIDKQAKTMERFESYGYGQYNTKKEHDIFKSFDKKMAQLYTNYTFISPEKFCPMEGLQEIEEKQINKNSKIETYSDPGGFCGVWSIWYAELRLKHPNMNRKQLLNQASKIIMKQKNLRSYIRKYSAKLNKERLKIVKTLKKKQSKIRNNSKFKLLYDLV